MFQDYHIKTKGSHHNVWLRCCKKKCKTEEHKTNYTHQLSKHSIKVDTYKKKCIKPSEKRWTMNTNRTMKLKKKMRTTTQKTSKAMGVQGLNEVRHCNTKYKTS